MIGTIKFFKEDKGFGFITGNDGEDIFCHISSFNDKSRKPKKGDLVDYATAPSDRKDKTDQAVYIIFC